MAKKVGSVYAEIRADIKKLQQDFDKAHQVTQTSAKKIQTTLDNGINFDKMKASVVAAGASIYASFRAVGQVIESAKIGSTLEKQAVAFSNLSDAAGTSSKRMIDSLKQSSQGLVAEADLMAAAGKAMLMSIPADKITELMKIAAATSKMTGQTITDAFNDITMGVARQSRMILDNLGIIVNVEKANEDYAKALGKTAASLSDAEQRQAFMNAVLKAGNDMIERLGSQGNALDGVNQLIAAQANLWNEVNKVVAQFLDKELAGYAKVLNWIDEKLKGMRASAGESSRTDAMKEIEMLRSLEAKGMAQPGSASNKFDEYMRRFGKELKPSEFMTESVRTQQIPKNTWQGMAGWREREGNFAANTEEQNKQLMKDREEMLKKLADEMKKAEDEAKKLADEIDKLDQEFQNSKIFSGADSQYEKMQAMLRTNSQLSDMEQRRIETESDEWAKEAAKWNENLMNKVAEYEKTHKNLMDLSERTAEAMQENFSNLFFDAMTGKLKTLEDYARAIFESIARMAADLMSQQATRALFGSDLKGGGLLSQLFGTSAGDLPINTPGAFASAQPFHSGGSVGSAGGAMRSIPAAYYHSAPRLHNGLMPDEYPAIMQKGETVLPKGASPSGGGGTYYFITAMDTQSIRDSLRRSGAVPMLAEENIRANGGLRKAIQTRAR